MRAVLSINLENYSHRPEQTDIDIKIVYKVFQQEHYAHPYLSI